MVALGHSDAAGYLAAPTLNSGAAEPGVVSPRTCTPWDCLTHRAGFPVLRRDYAHRGADEDHGKGSAGSRSARP